MFTYFVYQKPNFEIVNTYNLQLDVQQNQYAKLVQVCEKFNLSNDPLYRTIVINNSPIVFGTSYNNSNPINLGQYLPGGTSVFSEVTGTNMYVYFLFDQDNIVSADIMNFHLR